jgi:hypothetical protein
MEPGSVSNKRLDKVDNKVDVVLVMDVTASMQTWINSAKETVLASFAELRDSHPDSAFRLGCVCYRDFPRKQYLDARFNIDHFNNIDDNQQYIVVPLSDDIESVQRRFQTMKAVGGDDTAEDVAGGLQHLLELNWNSEEDVAKIILWVCDAPAHGNRYHTNTVDDRFPKGDPNGREPFDQVKELAIRGIDMTIFRVDKSMDKMIDEFSNAYQQAGNDSTFTMLNLVSSQKLEDKHDFDLAEMDVYRSISIDVGNKACPPHEEDVASDKEDNIYKPSATPYKSCASNTLYSATQDMVSASIAKTASKKAKRSVIPEKASEK